MTHLPEISGVTPTHALNVLRIVQEAVTNAIKHGHARRICVRGHASDGGHAAIAVENDGLPFVSENGGAGLCNMRRRVHMVELAREACGGAFLGRRVGVLGAAFKPDSDDVRDSPALNVAGQIHLQGAQVTVYDPKGMENAAKVFPTLGYAPSALEAVRGAEVVLHLTEWREFRELDPATLGDVVANRHLLDGRNALDLDLWRKAGWTVRAMGRPQA